MSSHFLSRSIWYHCHLSKLADEFFSLVFGCGSFAMNSVIWFRVEKDGLDPVMLEGVTIQDLNGLRTEIQKKSPNDIPCAVTELRLHVFHSKTSKDFELDKEIFDLLGGSVQGLINHFGIDKSNPIKVVLPSK